MSFKKKQKQITFHLDGSSFQNIWHKWQGFGNVSHLLAFLVSFGLRLLLRYSGFYSNICVKISAAEVSDLDNGITRHDNKSDGSQDALGNVVKKTFSSQANRKG